MVVQSSVIVNLLRVISEAILNCCTFLFIAELNSLKLAIIGIVSCRNKLPCFFCHFLKKNNKIKTNKQKKTINNKKNNKKTKTSEFIYNCEFIFPTKANFAEFYVAIIVPFAFGRIYLLTFLI